MNEPTTTPEWAVALDRFRGGYGGEPDLDDYTDRHLFLELLTYEIRARMEADMAEYFWREARQLAAAAGDDERVIELAAMEQRDRDRRREAGE